MVPVWVLTGLWASIFGLFCYFRFGINRKGEEYDTIAMADMDMHMSSMDMANTPGMANMGDTHMDAMPAMKKKKKQRGHTRPMWQKSVLSAFHCGAGCTLADIIGESGGYLWLNKIEGWNIVWQWGLDYLLALLIGVLFQYAAIHPMQKMSFSKTLSRAFKIDFFSLTSWQIGMYVCAWFIFFVFPGHLFHADSIMFWFIMQIAMSVGFLFAYPTNYILIKTGIKPGM